MQCVNYGKVLISRFAVHRQCIQNITKMIRMTQHYFCFAQAVDNPKIVCFLSFGNVFETLMRVARYSRIEETLPCSVAAPINNWKCISRIVNHTLLHITPVRHNVKNWKMVWEFNLSLDSSLQCTMNDSCFKWSSLECRMWWCTVYNRNES